MSEVVRRRGYRWVADVLQERIEAGDYPAGTRLPTEADLVEEFAVARDTVRRAIALLAERDLVVTAHGRGTFVHDAQDEAVGLPKHAQVSAQLRRLIDAAEFGVGAPFLTESQVQERYSVSRRTARAALMSMVDDGILYASGKRRLVAAQEADAPRPNSR